MYICAAKVRTVHKHIVKPWLLCKFFCKKSFSASWRTVKQHSVWRGYAVLLSFFFILDNPDYSVCEFLFQFVHSSHILKTATAASVTLYLHTAVLLCGAAVSLTVRLSSAARSCVCVCTCMGTCIWVCIGASFAFIAPRRCYHSKQVFYTNSVIGVKSKTVFENLLVFIWNAA